MKKRPHLPAPGHLHFVTVITRKRIPLFRSAALCQEFFAALKEVKRRFPFELYAYVLLPDHLHLLLNPSDADISRLMQKIKSVAGRRIVGTLKNSQAHRTLLALRKVKPGRRAHSHDVFQDSFRDLELWSPWMIRQKVDYIHKNPVNERLAENAGAYPWSSWRAVNELSGEPLPVDPLVL